MLRDEGYRWVSNREIRQPEELFRPGRLNHGMGLLDREALRRGVLLGLNLPLVLKERPTGGRRVLDAARWLLGRQQPFGRPEGLIEYPLTSPLDCDLLGYPEPCGPSSEAELDYAVRVLAGMFDRSADHFTINLHDWIIGTGRRIEVLDRVLAHVAAGPGTEFHLPGRAPGDHNSRSTDTIRPTCAGQVYSRSTSTRPASPSSRASAASVSTRCRAAARAPAWPGLTSRPVRPSVTRDGIGPIAAATTGTPCAQASRNTVGNASLAVTG